MAKRSKSKYPAIKSIDPNKQGFIDSYKNKQNLLLYGNDFFNQRREFIKIIWIENCGGVDRKAEYFLEDVSIPPKSPTSKEELENKFNKDWIGKYRTIDSVSSEGNSYDKELRIYIASHTHFTDKTWRYIDCEGWSGRKVYDEMVNCIGDINDHYLYNSRRSFLSGLMDMGYLFACKGLIFLDNLRYNLEDKGDDIYYHKLVEVISERKGKFSSKIYHNSKHLRECNIYTKFNWLVLYTRINSDFPDWFRGEFKETPFPIQSKTEVGQQEGEKTKKIRVLTENRGSRPKDKKHNEFMFILKDILSDDKKSSLGGYVIKVINEMERQNLKKKVKNTGELKLIYTDKTIRTYIQRHPFYKKIQKRKEKHKKV